MIISMENAQDKIVLGEYLEKRLQDGLNAVAKLHDLDDMTEVDITIVDDELVCPIIIKWESKLKVISTISTIIIGTVCRNCETLKPLWLISDFEVIS